MPLGFEISTLHKILDQPNPDCDPVQTHKVAFCALLFIDTGKGSHTIDFESYKMSPGDLAFIGNGQTQQFTKKKDFDGLLILFTENFLFRQTSLSNSILLNLLYPLAGLPPVIRTDHRLVRSIRMLTEEWNESNDFERADILRILLDYLLIQVCRLRNSGLVGADSRQQVQYFSTFFELIKTHHRSTRNANDYAKMLKLSYKHLNTICKQTCNFTAKQAIDRFVLIEAKRLLATGDDSIEELSITLGFDETTNFIKYFKRFARITPAQFRRRLMVRD